MMGEYHFLQLDVKMGRNARWVKEFDSDIDIFEWE